MSRLHFLIAFTLALTTVVPKSVAAESKTDDVKGLVGSETAMKMDVADNKASDEVGRLGFLSPNVDSYDSSRKAAPVKDDPTGLKKEDTGIKLKYEPKKEEEERGLWEKIKSFFKQNLETASAKSNQKVDDEMKKFWDTFYYKEETDKVDQPSKIKTEIGEAESRILETKEVKRKIKDKDPSVGTETLFNLGEKLFDQQFGSESDNVKIPPSTVNAAAAKKNLVSKVVYADEIATGDQMLDDKDDQVMGAQEGKWDDEGLRKAIGEEKDRKKKQKVDDPFKKTNIGPKVDEEKAHEDRAVFNAGANGNLDPRTILRGFLPSFGQGDDDYDDDEDEDDEYEDDDDNEDREDSSVWLRRAIMNDGIGSRIPLFLDSNLNLYVPIRIPSSGTSSSSNFPSFPGFQSGDGGNQGSRGNSGGQRFSRLTEPSEKNAEVKAPEAPFIKALDVDRRFGLLLYPWVPLKDLVEKVEDAMKELNIKANRVEAKTGAPLFEFGFEIIEVKEKKFLLETRTVKDPEGKRRVHVTLLAVKPITAEEAKRIEELKEEKKIIDELLDRKKELHEFWLKRKEEKAEEISKEKLEKAELIKALLSGATKDDNE